MKRSGLRHFFLHKDKLGHVLRTMTKTKGSGVLRCPPTRLYPYIYKEKKKRLTQTGH